MSRRHKLVGLLTSFMLGCGGSGSDDKNSSAAPERDAGEDVEPEDEDVDAGADAEEAAVDLTACDMPGEACCADAVCAENLACAGSVCTCTKQITNNLVVRADGRLIEVQAGTQTPIRSAATRKALTDVSSAHRGHSHGCALRADGSVWCWAAAADGNAAGQLGNGELAGNSSLNLASQVRINEAPAPAEYLSDVTSLQQGFSGYYNSTNCACRQDGSLFCWGAGSDGNLMQIGRNAPAATQILASVGTPVGDAVEVAVGSRHACYRDSAGAVYCWGTNLGGALGTGSDGAAGIYPVQVLGVGGAVRVTAGPDFSCALVGEGEDSGRVLCWGNNANGQIGIGPPANNTDGCMNHCKTAPARVKTAADSYLEGVVEIAAGYRGTCALTEERTVFCWGALGGDYATELTVENEPVSDVAQLAVHSRELRVLTSDSSYSSVASGVRTGLNVNCGLLD